MRDAERLAQFAEIVRDSSLKRFNRIAIEDVDWRPREDMLSFVDTLQHLVDSDRWLLDLLQRGFSDTEPVIQPGDAEGKNWELLLYDLAILGKERAVFIRGLSDNELETPIVDPALPEGTTWWFLIVQGILDHEIHHRGSLQNSLRLKYG